MHKFKTNVFPDIIDKRMNELTPAEQENAREDWIRANAGFVVGRDYYEHIPFLLRRLDEVRAAKAVPVPGEIHSPPTFNRDCDRDDMRALWNFWNGEATLDQMMRFREFLLSRGMAS